jgi:peroxiredoxin
MAGAALLYRMTNILHVFNRSFVWIGIFPLLLAGDLIAQTQTNSQTGWGDGFVKTNGAYVKIGTAMFPTNSTANTDEFKHFMWRDDQVWKLAESGASNALDLAAEGAWGLVRDYPDRPNGYQTIMMLIEDYGYQGKGAKSRKLAQELMASTAPEEYKLWAKGFLNRLNLQGKPVSLKFTAVDGRQVDLARMKGNVVLVDFWATDCSWCVAELPRVKAAFEKFHAQGFEVIGISCDTDQKRPENYVKLHGISWPQYFDGKSQDQNKFGIDGIPHMFLVDRQGRLRFDNVRASDKYRPKDDKTTFEEKITELLAEK